MKKISLILLICILVYSGFTQTLSDNIDISGSANGIVALPSDAPAVYKNAEFVKYTKIQAPNGQAIHFVAQNLITDAQIIRTRNILKFYLTNFPDSQYGTNKTAVINAMGTNEATVMLMNGADDGNPPEINAQPLYQNEIAVEGHQWYINNDYENHRDATFEEILHLMHDRGIGVDENGTPSDIGVLPAYQAEIRAAQKNAVKNNFAIWPIGEGTSEWYTELTNENSLSQEYFASVVDSYYGLWAAWTGGNNTTGMWGMYIAKTREEIITEDPMGYDLMPKYFSPVINIDIEIDPTFNGTFQINFDASKPYTHKSQYLQHCILTGTKSSNLKGNDLYNRLTGNVANNILEGMKGNDRLDGKEGADIAKFSGNKNDYAVTKQGNLIIVKDNSSERDGIDTLINIETLRFADGDIEAPLNIKNIAADEVIKIYPNPATDIINIEWTNDTPIKSGYVQLYDQTGRLLEQKIIGTTSVNTKLDVSSLETGNYTIRIIGDNYSSNSSIIVK